MDLIKTAETLLDLVRQAGEIELKYQKEGFEVIEKKDGSPVTMADRDAEALIEKYLTSHFPEIPFVGEEAVSAGKIPDISKGTFWLVDALDGTKSFVRKETQFTVNIALLRDFTPVMGVIYIPAQDKYYYGAEGQAFSREGIAGVTKSISVRKNNQDSFRVVSSKRLKSNPEEIYELLGKDKVKEIITMSSSCKFCAVAEGSADIYPQLHETCEWDIAAGEALVKAAGGHLKTIDGQKMQYGKVANKFNNPHFIASAN